MQYTILTKFSRRSAKKYRQHETYVFTPTAYISLSVAGSIL